MMEIAGGGAVVGATVGIGAAKVVGAGVVVGARVGAGVCIGVGVGTAEVTGGVVVGLDLDMKTANSMTAITSKTAPIPIPAIAAVLTIMATARMFSRNNVVR